MIDTKNNTNTPRHSKYHIPVIRVTFDQKEVWRSNPWIAETIIAIMYIESATNIGDFGIETLLLDPKNHIPSVIESIDTNNIKLTDLVDVPEYR